MAKGGVTLKILSILVFSDVLETFTNFCFKKGALPASALQISNPAEAFVFVKTVLLSWFLWVGFLSVLATFIIWSTVLSKIDLSVAVPIASFSYILVPLASIFFLHEKITALRWAGIFFILAGVIFVSLSTKKNESPVR
ncbi:MAG: EamA family transporter [Candidatus Omnitrophica bacterium]|nr:EamA family transporter [Candidatus Omnitrophota bacterium]